MPEFEGKLSAVALNVPVPDGSTVDLVTITEKPTTKEEVNQAIQEAAATRYRNIIEYVSDPIVSSDVRGSTYSGVFDSLATMVIDGTMVKTITRFATVGAIPRGWLKSSNAFRQSHQGVVMGVKVQSTDSVGSAGLLSGSPPDAPEADIDVVAITTSPTTTCSPTCWSTTQMGLEHEVKLETG